MKIQGIIYHESIFCDAPTLPTTYRMEVPSLSINVFGGDGTSACFKKHYMCQTSNWE